MEDVNQDQVNWPTQMHLEPQVSLPSKFDGSQTSCRNFLNQVQLIFFLQPKRYSDNRTKVGFCATLLTGAAASWFSPLFESNSPLLNDWNAFSRELAQHFGGLDRAREAANQLHSLKQGALSASDYASKFRLLSSDLAWGENALVDLFHRGLRDEVKDLMITLPHPKTLMEAVSFAVRCDNRLSERKEERSTTGFWTARTSKPSRDVVPMELDATKRQVPGMRTLSTEEKTRRRMQNLCLYCGGKGHFLKSCPVRQGNGAVRFN